MIATRTPTLAQAQVARLGVNLDHIATLRQLRGTPYPSLRHAAEIVQRAGAEQITVHLREDRRHIQDEDVRELRRHIQVPLNLEMAVADEIVRFALKIRPDWACLVPEKRREVTTEGGLDLRRGAKRIAATIQKLQARGIRVSLFIEPKASVVRQARELGADAVELHTGKYCGLTQRPKPAAPVIRRELSHILQAAETAREIGIHAHAGHGFDAENVRAVAAWRAKDGSPLIEEFNIGHALVCRAVLVGLERAVREMVSAIGAP
jgi:pyridoxine 5-phosphate synthase